MPIILLSLLSAFLLFQIQPMISKLILPWFGGSPGVWTTAMLFFQLLLLGGYAYAHGLTRLAKKTQLYIHGGLLVIALLWWPFQAAAALKPAGTEDPSGRILLLLGAAVGLHYFLLSTTSPLVQHWFSRAEPGRSPWRLYALSNVGSLAALLTYPFLIEPNVDLQVQMKFWTYGFLAFGLLAGYCLWRDQRTTAESSASVAETPVQDAPAPSLGRRALWLLLPAFASILLLATTNHVCTDVAVIPFLWVVPLSLYLLTFIICFDSDRWYVPWFWALLAGAAAVWASALMHVEWDDVTRWLDKKGVAFEFSPTYVHELVYYFGLMFLGCLVAHGELARLRPAPKYLTSFYLHMSAGGALGGLLINLVAPRIFTWYAEWPIALMVVLLMAALVLWRYAAKLSQPWLKWSAGAALACLFLWGLHGIGWWEFKQGFTFGTGSAVSTLPRWEDKSDAVEERVRNFYGTLSIEKTGEDSGYETVALVHGSIRHGSQMMDPEYRERPLNYYGEEAGIGQALAFLADKPNARVGVVGMGTGTVGCYAKAGHVYRFYEINPEIPRLALKHFTYLADMERRGAKAEVLLGDARLVMEREEPQKLDVIILDAFSGDSIPVHLLTKEAMLIYQRHLNPDGVLIVHMTNRYVNLAPVANNAAELLGQKTLRVTTDEDELYDITDAMLLTNNEKFLSIAKPRPPEDIQPDPVIPLWTDGRSDLFSIIKRD
jgi:hypothetical protein